MKRMSFSDLSNKRKIIIGVAIVALTLFYLLNTVAIAQTSGTSSITGNKYEVDQLSLGDIWQFDYANTKYSAAATKKIAVQNEDSTQVTSAATQVNSYYGYLKITNKAVDSSSVGITSAKGESFFKNSSYTASTVASPVSGAGNINILTAPGSGGQYTVVPNSAGSYRVYVYSPGAAPESGSVSYFLVDSYKANNNFAGGGAAFTGLSDFAESGNGWYYATLDIEKTVWTGWSVSCESNTSSTTGTGEKSSAQKTDTLLGGGSSTTYYNTWKTEEAAFETLLVLKWNTGVSLGPITKQGDNFSISCDSEKGSVTVQNIFGETISTTVHAEAHAPMFISATPIGTNAFTGLEGGAVTPLDNGMYRYDFEGPASLTAKFEQLISLPTVTVDGNTIDAYFKPSGSSTYTNGSDKNYTFTADFTGVDSGVTLSYTMTNNGVSSSGTLTNSNPSFSTVASFDTVTVTFTATSGSTTKTMTYELIGSNAGLTPVARIGTTAGTNEYYFLEDALLSSNNGTSGKIYLIADYTMYAGDNPRESWGSGNKGYTVKSGVTLVVPYDAAGTDYTTQPGGKSRAAATKDAAVYRTLFMPSSTKLIINGVLSLPAMVSRNNNNHTGTVAGNHGLISMSSGSTITINNGGVLYCWGYITGSGEITANSGATIYEAFQIADYRGGTATSNLAGDKKTFPFSQYYIQNIEATLVLNYGAVENTVCRLYSTSYTSADVSVPFVKKDSGGMFNLTSTGGSFVKSYDPITERATYEVRGNATLSSITVNAGASVNSANFNLPIMQNATIHIVSGTTTINQSLCMIPGSRLTVDSGATVSINSGKSVFVYDRDEWVQSDASRGYIFSKSNYVPVLYSPTRSSKWTSVYKLADMVDVKVDNNGTISVNGSLYTTSSGADIISSAKTGTVELKTKPTAETTTYQYMQGTSPEAYNNITAYAAWLHNGDDSYTPTAGAAANTTYTYCAEHNQWEKSPVTVTFNANDGSASPATATQSITRDTATALTANAFTYTGHAFAGWNTVADGTGVSYADGVAVTLHEKADITLYAQWAEKASISPTVAISGWTYGDVPSSPIVTGNTGNAAVTYTYKVKDDADNTYTSTVPTAAGEYTVKAAIAETDDYKSGEATADFSIAQKEIGLSWGERSLTYSGNALVPSATATGLIQGDSCAVTVTGGQTDVGTYTATASNLSNANYKLPAAKTISFTITPANMTVTATGYTGTYDGVVHGITVNAPAGATVTYSANGTSFSDTMPTYTNVGSATVYYKVEKDNYNTVTGSADVVITQKGITDATVTLGDPLTYTGSEQTQTVSSVVIDGLTVTFDLSDNTGIAAGSYTLTVTGNGNFTGTVTKEFSISKATPVVAAPAALDPTYSGEAQALVAAGSTTGGTLQYKLDDGTYGTTVPTATNAGIYTVYYKVVGNANYNDVAEAGVSVTIERKSVTVSGITANAKEYDGNTNATLVTTGATFSGIVSGDTLTVTASGAFDSKNAGTGKTVTIGDLTLGGTSLDNYVLAASGNQSSASADITAKSVTISGLSASDKIYDGTTDTTATGTAGLVGMIEGDDVSVTNGSAAFADANVGTGKIVSFTGYGLSGADAGNYILTAQPSDSTANITLRPLTVTAASDSKTYDGTALTNAGYSITSGTLAEGQTLSGVTVIGSQTDAGSGSNVPSAVVIMSGDTDVTTNYVVTYANGVLTITKAAATVTAQSATKTYGESDPALTATVEGLVGEDMLNYTLARATGEDVGEYSISVTIGENPNYDVTTVSGTFTVLTKIATPTVTLSQTEYTYDGTEKTPTVTLRDGGTVIPASEYDVSYSGSTNAGSATVTVTDRDGGNYSFEDVNAQFTIVNADQAAPEVGGHDETIYGREDGSITGLTAAMEWSVDGETYSAVEGDALTGLAAGTYYVRYAAKTNYNASPVTEISIARGRMLVITWKQDDGTTIDTTEVVWNGTPNHADAVKQGYIFTGWMPAITAVTEDTEYTATYVLTVARIGNASYPSLKEAVAVAEEDDTIKLVADDTVSLTDGSELEINKSLTITGATDAQGNPLYTVYGKSSVTGYNDIFITGSGTVNLENLKIRSFGNNTATDIGHAPIYVSSNFTGTVNLDNLYISEFNRGGVFLYGGSFNVTDCYIDCANSRSGAFTKGIEIKNGTSGTISDTFICNMERSTSAYASAGIEIYGSGDITVDGCTIVSYDGVHESVLPTYGIVVGSVGAYNPAGGELTITDTMISTTNGALSVDAGDYAVTLEDNSFDNYIVTWNAGSTVTVNSGDYAEDVYADAGTIIIHGGEFTSFAPDTDTGRIVIDGGTFDAEVPEQYCASGYIPKDNGDGTYTVEPGWHVTFVNYDGTELSRTAYPLNATPTYAGETPAKPSTSDTLYVFTGWTPEIVPVTEDAVYTALFSETTYSVSLSFSSSSALLVSNTTTVKLTITRDGTPLNTKAEYTAELENWVLTDPDGLVEVTKTTAYAGYIGYTIKGLAAGETTLRVSHVDAPSIYAEQALTVDHKATLTVTPSGTHLVEDGAVEITALKFDGLDAELGDYSFTSSDNGIATTSGTVVTPVSSGTITVTVIRISDGATATASLAFKDAAARIGNDYYDTVANAMKAAASGDTVTLVRDVTESVSFTGNTPRVDDFELTLDLNGHTLTGAAASSYALRVDYGIVTVKDSLGGGGIHYGKDYAIIVSHLAGDYTSRLILERGTFTGKTSVAQVGLRGGSNSNLKYYGGELVITGGTFITEPDTGEIYDANGNYGYTLNMLDVGSVTIYSPSSITVSGGTFKQFDPKNNLAEGANTNFLEEHYDSYVSEAEGVNWYTVDWEQFAITWLDGDGNTLETAQVVYNNTPVYEGETPTKTTDADYTYTFNGTWVPEIVPAVEDATYTAQFDAAQNVAQVGEDYFTSLSAAVEAAQPGDTVTLLKGAAETRVTISKSLTLNLNGNTFTGRMTVDNGTVTVEDGVIVGRFDTYDSAVVTLAADATVNGQTVVWGDGTYGEVGCKTPTLNVYGTITNTGDSAISTNGTDTSGAIINVYDGAVITSTDEIGIYLPSGNLTVSGGEITGTTAVYAKSGSVTISGGTLTGNGVAAAYSYNGNGGNATGDALVIDTCGYPNGAPSVSVTGGAFISVNAQAIASYATEGNTAATGFVEGGEFSSIIPKALMADGVLCTTMLTNESGHYYVVEEISVTFVVDGEIYASVLLPKGEAIPAEVKPADPTSATRLFAGWYVDETGYDLSETFTASTTLTATWIEAVGQIGSTPYASLSAAVEAAQPGDTLTLLKGAAETRVTISKSLTLDLNGNIFTGRMTIDNGTVTVEGGTIVGRFDIYDNATVTLAADATVTGQAVAWGDGTYGEQGCKTPTLNVYGTITNTGDSAISTNGMDRSGANINVYDGAVVTSTDEIGVYLPSGNLTVSGGEITGSTAVYVKSGSVTVTGGTLAGYGAAEAYSYNGNGGNATGDAMVIDTCSYPNGAPSVSVSGGTFISANARAIASYATEGNTAAAGFVEGGEFNTSLDADIIVDGMLCTTTLKNENGYYYLVKKVIVTFDSNGGSVVEAAALPMGEAVAEPETSRTGYTFVEWQFSGAAYDFNSPVIEDIELTAVWTANPYTITWLDDDGSVIDTTTVSYDDLPTHDDPAKADTADYHYDFARWTPAVETVTGDATYTATYTATERTYDEPVWTWDGTESASAAFTTNDVYTEFTLTEVAVITHVTTTAETCEEDGVETYTATVTFRGQTYTNDKEEIRTALGHDYTYTYVWSGDNSRVIARRVCQNDRSHTDYESVETTSEVTKEANCIEHGEITYTAIFTSAFFETQTKIVETPFKHNYEGSEWVWLDHTTAYVQIRCSECGTAMDTVAATVTGPFRTEPTCEEDGTITYIATAVYNGQVLIDETVETIPATGHMLTEHEAHDATCTDAGNTRYWSCDVCGRYFSDAEGETEIEADSWMISANGHSYELIGWAWAEDYSSATATFTCTSCGESTNVTDSLIESVSTPATPESLGSITYTASVVFEGIEYTDEEVVSVDYKKLDYPNFTIVGVTETFNPDLERDIVTITNTTTGKFEVRYSMACVVAVKTSSVVEGETVDVYTRLHCLAVEGEDEAYFFDLTEYGTWDESVEIIVAVKGDVNGDGRINALDAGQVKAASISKLQLREIGKLTGDVNSDGRINALDAGQVKAASISKLALKWDIQN